MSKARDLADFISTGSILSDGTIESTEISGVTADATEINKLDGLTADTAELNKLDGVTATTAELNKLAGTTATTSDFDKLSNVTASATELNYMSGATSSIQNQLDNISVTSGSLTKSFTNGETASITLSSALSTAPVVGVTKEVAQTGISSKGAWDVNATASNYELHNTAYDTTLAKGSISVTSDVSGSSYDSVTFSVASQQGDPQGCTFGDNGYKLYVAGKQPQAVHQYNLTTAYDLSTASYASKVLSTSANSNNTRAVEFKSDGTVAYVMDDQGGQLLIYNLSTAWDISTAGSPTAFGLSANGRGIAFKPDGTKFYFGSNTDVKEYTLSTAWDTSTATLTHTASGITATELAEIALSSDGSRLYILNRNGNNIEDYTLSTAYDLSTVSSQVSTFSTASQDSDEQGIMLNGDDSKIYMIGKTNDLIYQYTNSTTATDALVLGTGSFASTDVGKRIQGNGGDVILTSTAGAYDTTGGSDFTDTSTIASGSWTMHGLQSAGASSGLTLASYINTVPNAGGSTEFDAGSDRIQLLNSFNLNQTQDFTIEVFTKPINGESGVIVASDFDGTAATGVTSGTNQQLLRIYQGKGYTYLDGTNLIGTTLLADDTWHHLALVRNYSTVTLYVNGVAEATGTYSPAIYVNQISGLGWTSVLEPLIGQIAQLRYVIGAQVYTSNFTVPTAPLSTHSSGDTKLLLFQGDNLTEQLTNNGTESSYAYDSGTTKTFLSDNPFTTVIGVPTSQYHIAATNSGGQIDTAFWTDINSMTADQSLGDGEAYYAVSTDDRTTWSVAKASDGVRPIVRNNAGTWQYNSDGGSVVNSLSAATYNNKSYTSSQTSNQQDVVLKPDGTKMYILDGATVTAYQYSLSTSYDVSTATYDSVSFSFSSQASDPYGITFNNTGTKLYMIANGSDDVFQYSLSTAYDISTATYDNVSFDATSQQTGPIAITFNNDGTKMYITGWYGDDIYQYSLSTAYDISTASYDSINFNTGTQDIYPTGMSFINNGYNMIVAGTNSDTLYEYDLSTAYDISTASYSNNSFSLSSQSANPNGMSVTSGYVYVAHSGNVIYQYSIESIGYSTSTTWTNATTNDEFYALQQALGATSVNRMDKTQLDAVADGSHFTLGDTLDLAIALKQDTASASLPTSDGVSINYDAEALNQGAVLGTDYDYDFPDSTTVRITSNAAQNLKIRVV